MKNVVVFGSSGALGREFVLQCAQNNPQATVCAVSRAVMPFDNPQVISYAVDQFSEVALEEIALKCTNNGPIDVVIVATGALHDTQHMPEKSISAINYDYFQKMFEVNTIIPTLIAKCFLPKMNKENRSLFAAISARVGSISDNKLGGWYAYRASKAALNMVIKTLSIEMQRKNHNLIIAGLHPGTVASNLSQPFQKNVSATKLFDPSFSVTKMLDVLMRLEPHHSGKCFAWDGSEILP